MSLELLQELAEARTQYIQQMPLLNQPQREFITQQFFSTEQSYLGIAAAIALRQAQSQGPVTISFPIDLSAFNNPVLVTPSQEQVTREVEDYIHPSIQRCSICQDDISSDGARLRVCQHSFHRTCIQTWFGASVRCPVCRRDIREDLVNQTSSASIEISSQAETQLEEENTEE